MSKILTIAAFFSIFAAFAFPQATASEDYLSWNRSQIKKIGKQMREKGRMGSHFDFRGLNTDKAISYKLRATLMSPAMIQASARLEQLTYRLSDDETRALVKEAGEAADLVIMIEIDPNEGSGVVPLDWRVFIQPKGGAAGSAIAGVKSAKLKKIKALKGVFQRKYAFDLFMVSFPLFDENGNALLSEDTEEIELIVGIKKSEGKISWKMPMGIRTMLANSP